MVHADGGFRQRYEALSDERKISTWSAKVFPDCIVGSPYPLNDRRVRASEPRSKSVHLASARASAR
jgi:hypothetical protein